jgi:hypothetical protein
MIAKLGSFAVLTVLLAGCGGGSTAEQGDENNITQGPQSAYTSLEDCKLISQDQEADVAESLCSGMGDYQLRVSYLDARENVTVLSSKGESDLELQSWFPELGYLGPKAEWRGKALAIGKVAPSALIFRYFHDQGEPSKEVSHLFVVALDPEASCVIDVVDGTEANANQRARDIADNEGCTQGE